MLKNWLKKAWKFCTEPSSHDAPVLLPANVEALNKWLARENFRDYILSSEYHISSVAQFEKFRRVNPNASISGKKVKCKKP